MKRIIGVDGIECVVNTKTNIVYDSNGLFGERIGYTKESEGICRYYTDAGSLLFSERLSTGDITRGSLYGPSAYSRKSGDLDINVAIDGYIKLIEELTVGKYGVFTLAWKGINFTAKTLKECYDAYQESSKKKNAANEISIEKPSVCSHSPTKHIKDELIATAGQRNIQRAVWNYNLSKEAGLVR